MLCVMGGGEMRLLMSRLFAGYSLTCSPYGLAKTSINLFSYQWEASAISVVPLLFSFGSRGRVIRYSAPYV